MPPQLTQNKKNGMGYKTLNKNTCRKKYTWMNAQKNIWKGIHSNSNCGYF